MAINVDELFDVANQDGAEAWHQQPDEPDNWYLLFMRYCRRGPTRSILGIFNEYRVEQGHKRALRVSGGFERRTKKHDWENRALAFDRTINKLEAEEWMRVRAELREKELAFSTSLLEKARQMLQFPITTTKTEQTQNNGQTIIQNTFIPARWDFSTTAKIIETADRLQRLALELETSRAVVDATVEKTDDIEQIRRKRWEAIAQQLGEALSGQDDT